MNAAFIIHPLRWVRWWVHFTQRINGYELMNVWIADQVEAPMQLFTNIPVKVPEGCAQRQYPEGSVEMNTSDLDLVRADLRALVSYIRNFSGHTMDLGWRPYDYGSGQYRHHGRVGVGLRGDARPGGRRGHAHGWRHNIAPERDTHYCAPDGEFDSPRPRIS